MTRPKAILYVRVSTPGQADKGYSLREQEERLRAYAEERGLEILAAIEDAGVSGAAFDRPGLNRVRELVAEGGVSVVLATERDRFAREPAYLYLLRKECEEHGARLKALNDQGDDSPVGELTAGMLDQISKFYRATFAAKSMENKKRKAREGKASGSGTPPYGFAYSEDRRSLVVEEARMAVVRRIFEGAAGGATLNAVKRALEAEGVPTPGGGERWYPVSMARMVRNDAYLPRTVGELREAGVGEEALAGLDADARYGDLVVRAQPCQAHPGRREAPQVRGAARERVDRHARARLGHSARDRRGGAGEFGRGLPPPRQVEAPLRARRDALLLRVWPAHVRLQHRHRLPLLHLPEAQEVGPEGLRGSLVGRRSPSVRSSGGADMVMAEVAT